MKKRVIAILEVESEDDINISDKFIKNDLEQEISCASNRYETISIQTTEIDDPPILNKQGIIDALTHCYVVKDCKGCPYEKYALAHINEETPWWKWQEPKEWHCKLFDDVTTMLHNN